MRPALIFGGAGFIGSNVAERLLANGQRVRIYDSLARPGVERNLRWLQERFGKKLEVLIADVRDAESVRAAVKGTSQVFHFAAQVAVTTSLDAPVHDFDVNARGTLNVLEAIRGCEQPPPLLFTSTNKVYGGLHDVTFVQKGERYAPKDEELERRGLSEARPLDFESPYGCSKGCADQYVLDYARTYGLNTAVFRMSCIYGPRQFGNEDQGWVAHFLIQALAGKPITLYGDGMQVRDVLFVQDLVDAFLLGQQHIARIRGQAFNLGGGPRRSISLLELLDRIHRLTGRAPTIRFEDWRTGDQRYYVSNTRKFEQATGWKARTSVADGVRALHVWLLEMSSGSNTVEDGPALAAV
jgi:CDP-paratose 2-epimerase